ncbi:RdgB/HAM1 family non-canonical purine NTP pyrophosphatase [Acetobacter oeni]|uniref:dITP/XTP pyrophosphatase n=1 Tax=Acetobacter oeni TaxID=304077 RepID=A0A511XLP9_9PROT|nr:RdgB/HAM1 family non-canonical purine NTP pyrophosphatase [Acetobacter oeni]MBB3881833.1 XTP/dITP diphosphohydrolase [Acetobacter oeni]NHO17840.1 RdgB/HAM1 family non-canonical purine NTP pyrophosphatase [Acetobacter oeni]GBR07597.1 deoxyribonucleotide triphosphate pyrophosphatase [Acetobacter oeni LMG 21952]GEN63876.1 non-canonical purine NTP pyrophosphatase [Acetobacter oeni]
MSTALPLARDSRLVLASHNKGKLAEFSTLLNGYGITVISAGELGLPEPDETATTFSGNAELKALAAAKAANLPALSDDSGLCVAALDGAPGIYSARWAGPEKDFADAMQRIETGIGSGSRDAWFICVLCLAFPDGTAHCFEGRIDGTIAPTPRGNEGHGYDPVFIPAGETRTFAEMSDAEKNRISHRARAFETFRAACLN